MTRSVRHLLAPIWCVLGAWGFLISTCVAADQPPKNHSVQTTAAVQENPPRITLSWVPDGNASGYRISRKTAESGWQQLAEVSGATTTWSDGNVSSGTVYEYQLVKSTRANYYGVGYVASGIRVPLPDQRGKILLVLENSVASALAPEIDRLQQDLTGDGWVVLRRNVSMNDSPGSVRNVIKSVYDSDRANVRAVLLFGHVPVAYSGNIAPDGHDNHRGAWPADVFYGDMDGTWTDHSVNTRTAEREINRNVPGDGKFDQSVIPSAIELMVGRVDLHNMTCFANKSPSRSELDLLRQYLNKNNAYRHGWMSFDRRAIICDNFADKGEDPIAGSAWRAFPGSVGPQNILEAPWDGFFPATTQNSFLWAFASGGGSYYYSMGIGTSDDFALKDVKVVFAMFMGSYFGDWNNESNFLRAALGSGNILTATYSGFPQTLYFPMSIGEPIGHCIRLTQNNLANTTYAPFDQGQGEVHVALMGDPTLRLYPVKPAASLNISTGAGTATLNWSASPDSNLQGYAIYRATSPEGPFTRVSQNLVTGFSFTDSPGAGSYSYMVRAVKLEQSPSGTFFNPSQGIFASASVSGSVTPQPPPAPSLQANVVSFSRVDLQWSDVAGENGYRIERKVSSSGSWSEIASVGANTSSYVNESLNASTEYFYRVRAFNGAGLSPYSTEVRAVTHAAPQAQATVQFVELDSTTSGNWPSKFGSDGYLLAARAPNLAATYEAALSGKQDFIWQSSSTDPRAPFVSPNVTQRVASAWFGDSIQLTLNTGATARRLALYLLDWDGLGRAQRVTVRDGATGVVLDSREVNNFNAGRYLVYDVKDSVRITLDKIAGPNALLSGIFVGQAAVAPISNKPLTLSLRRASVANQLTLRVTGDSGQKFRIDTSANGITWSRYTIGTLVTTDSELTITVSPGFLFIRAVNSP